MSISTEPRAATAHYDDLLGPVYLWSVGGLDAALAHAAADVSPWVPGRGLAVDLGAGFGAHTIALARGGWQVLAIEACEALCTQLADLAAGLDVQPLRADLLDAVRRLEGRRADLILCMGDTLTHLAEPGQVEALLRALPAALAPAGRFVATFRDYATLPNGTARFIPVRADDERVLTCFLEAERDQVVVHDVLYERRDGQWHLRVGAYRKRRLAPEAVCAMLAAAGLDAQLAAGPRGMLRLVATAAA